MLIFNRLIILIQEQLAYKSSQAQVQNQLKEPSRSNNKVSRHAARELLLPRPKAQSRLTISNTHQLTPPTCLQHRTAAPQPMTDGHPSTCLQRPSPALNPHQSLSCAEAHESASNLRRWSLVTPTTLTGVPTDGSPGCQPLGGEGDSG